MNPEDGKWFSLLWELGDLQVGRIQRQGQGQEQEQAEAEVKWRYGLPRRWLPHLHVHPMETMCGEPKGQSNP
jgi:hypothetical protein